MRDLGVFCWALLVADGEGLGGHFAGTGGDEAVYIQVFAVCAVKIEIVLGLVGDVGSSDNTVDAAKSGAGAREAEEGANFAFELVSWFGRRLELGHGFVEFVGEGWLADLFFWRRLILDNFQ